MSGMPRSRPRGNQKKIKQNSYSGSSDIYSRNKMQQDDFYGGAASKHNPSVGGSRNSGSSSYENWKRNKKRKKSNLRNRKKKRSSYSRHSSGRRFLWSKFFTTLLVAVLVVFLAGFVCSANFRTTVISGVFAYVYNHTHDDPGLTADNSSADGETADTAKEIIYTTVNLPKEEVNRGNLILVNNDNEYNFDANADVIKLVSMNEEHHSSFSIYNELEVGSVMMNALNNMFDDFYNATGNNQVRIISAYRSYDYQSDLYDSKVEEVGSQKAAEWAALPGFSEHHTGMAVDIAIADGEGAKTFTTEGDYGWVATNCYKYGLVNRYDESKKDITGIMDEPWHYRYVGIPHAYIMYNNNLCLEEYIENLKYYSYKGEHLKVTVDNGTNYEIYYVKGSFRNGLPVPKNYNYEISGNNVDGFVVTVNMSSPK